MYLDILETQNLIQRIYKKFIMENSSYLRKILFPGMYFL